MKRRLACLPLLLVLASAPALRAVARAQDNGPDQKDAGDNADKPQEEPKADGADAPDDVKPADGAEAPKSDAGDEKPMISIKVISPEDDKPAQADVSVVDAPKSRAHKKASKAKPARMKARNERVKTPDVVKKAVAPPAAPPPPPAVPSTPVEPWNP